MSRGERVSGPVDREIGRPDAPSFAILGGLEVYDGDRSVRLGGPVAERILTLLLLENTRSVPIHRLVDVAWDDDPPRTAEHQVRKAVAELRKRIPSGSGLIRTQGSGYAVHVVDPDQLDLLRFDALTDEARAAVSREDWLEAMELLDKAVASWRGPLLNGSGGRVIGDASRALEERYLEASATLLRLRIEHDDPSHTIPRLRALVDRYPMRESLRALLMTALARAGRRGDALAEYAKAREMLIDELGLEPGGELRGTHAAILREDDADEAGAAAGRPEGPGAARFTLPRQPGNFVGREHELASLDRIAEQPSAVAVLHGLAGSGKSALAIAAAHRLAPRYPDGQLFVSLRGYSPTGPPREAMEALGTLLRSFDPTARSIPSDMESREAAWRDATARSRILVVLDNARDVAQILPLLPTSPDSLVIVTSRQRMPELDGASFVPVLPLRIEQSRDLLASMLGFPELQSAPADLDRLTELCGHLPLTLTIAAGKLRGRPPEAVSQLVRQLQDQQRGLAALRLGRLDFPAMLTVSYEALQPAEQRLLRLLGTLPLATVDAATAAALLELSPAWEAEEVLEGLRDAHLIEEHDVGNYQVHDLVRRFAASTADAAADDVWRRALVRVADHFVRLSDRANAIAFRVGVPTAHATESGVDEPFATRETANHWWEASADTAASLARLCLSERAYVQAAQLARNLCFHLEASGQVVEFGAAAALAAEAAKVGVLPLPTQRVSQSNLAAAFWKRGDLASGLEAANRASELAQQMGDPAAIASCLNVEGLLRGHLGEIGTAIDQLERACDLLGEGPPTRTYIYALCNLSSLREWRGDLTGAVTAAQTALEIACTLGVPAERVAAANDLSIALLRSGRTAEAARVVSEAVELIDGGGLDHKRPLTYALAAWAHHQPDGDDDERCADFVEGAHRSLTDATPGVQEAVIHNVLGRLALLHDDATAALEHFRTAAHAAHGSSFVVEEIRARHGEAQALVSTGDREAKRLRRLATDRAEEIGLSLS